MSSLASTVKRGKLSEKSSFTSEDKAGLRVWFDGWRLIPGKSEIDNIERGLQAACTCAVLVGADGQGPWQQQEVKAAIRNQIQNKDFRAIPVLGRGDF